MENDEENSRMKILCRRYLGALAGQDMGKMRTVFTENAIVISPIFGVRRFEDFYETLFRSTQRSSLSFLGTYFSDSAPNVALHFNYVWSLKSGSIVDFDCVDLFSFDGEAVRFSELKIIYDTAVLGVQKAALQSPG